MKATILQVPLVDIGLVGVHYSYLDGNTSGSCSGCGPLARWLRAVNEGQYATRAYGGHSFTGALVVDKSAVLEAHPSLAIRSPLCDLRLSAGAIARFKDIAANSMVAQAFREDEGRSGEFGQLVRLADASQDDPGPLDSVDLQTYARWWRARGARIGLVVGEPPHVGISWQTLPVVGRDTGTETPVLPEFAAQGVDPIIPVCSWCHREGHLIDDCPDVDPRWLENEEFRGL